MSDRRLSKVVLVVAEEPLVLDLLAAVLADEGYDVKAAATAAEALGQLDALTDVLNALVVDAALGGASIAPQIVVHARAVNPRVAVVYLCDQSPDGGTAPEVSGNALVRKPYRLVEVTNAVAREIAWANRH